MDNKRFSLEEFAALFPGRFASQEQLLREYRSFLAVFERLDRASVPELSAREKAEIFRRSWQDVAVHTDCVAGILPARGMGVQPMNHRQSLPPTRSGDADATKDRGRDARDTVRLVCTTHPTSWAWTWLALFKRPAVTFAMGIVLGCALMFIVLSGRPDAAVPTPIGPAVAVDKPLTVEHTRYTQVYKGKLVEQLHPDIENPTIVLEKTGESSPPQRVLYGTLDDGEVYVVWNL